MTKNDTVDEAAVQRKIGDVGFVFHKFFKGHGWFEGQVIQIRPNAAKNKTRRVLYSDGDLEDVSLKEIRSWISSYEKHCSTEKKMESPSPGSVSFTSSKIKSKQEGPHSETQDFVKGDEMASGCSDVKVPVPLASDNCNHDLASIASHGTKDNRSVRKIDVVRLKSEETTTRRRKAPCDVDLCSKNHSRKKRKTMSLPANPTQKKSQDVGETVSNPISVDSASKVVPENGETSKHTNQLSISSQEDHEKTSTQLSDTNFRRSLRKRDVLGDDGRPKVGQVGFIFSKAVSGSGVLRGMVVEILPDFMRRCIYSNGFQEDLTVYQLKKLKQLEESRGDDGDDELSLEVTSSKGNHFKEPTDDNVMKDENESDSCDGTDIDFDMADDIIPVDDTLESALHYENQVNQMGTKTVETDGLEDDDEPSWLTKVATLVNSKTTKSRMKTNASSANTVNDTMGDKCEQSRNIHPYKIDSPVLLVHVPKDKRLGCKVVCLNDEERIVGKVLCENKFGWVEVDVGNAVKRERTSHFLAVSQKHTIGECMKDIKGIQSDKTGEHLPRQMNGPKCKDSVTIGSLFYWFCRSCKITNPFTNKTCDQCKQHRIPGTDQIGRPSALLDVVEKICIAAGAGDVSLEIPLIYQPSIPQIVIRTIQSVLRGDYSTAMNKVKISSTLSIDSVFYWKCSHCTVDNTFRRWSCTMCKKKRGSDSLLSPLLQIATEAAREQLYLRDALERIPAEDACAIPDIVMRHLVTCIAIASSSKRRCLLPTHGNSPFCILHQDVISLNNHKPNEESKLQVNELRNDSINETDVTNPFISIDDLIENVRGSLRRADNTQENVRNWKINCIEDSFLCERNEPYPIGLVVRRYFPGYGFHDGSIAGVSKRQVMDDDELRPVLLYRIKYNDGDEEDLLHHEVNSLRQIYDVRSIKPSLPCANQIEPGTIFKTLNNGKVQVLRIEANENNPKDQGTVFAKIWKPNQKEIETEIDLTKFQKFVAHKISHGKQKKNRTNKHWLLSGLGRDFKRNITKDKALLPFLEWPPMKPLKEAHQCLVLSERSLKLSMQPCLDCSESDKSSDSFEDETHFSNAHRIIDDETRHSRVGVPQISHDPAGVRNFISYTPFEFIKCDICKTGENDHYLLICDTCDKGFHTYCLRPVVVNIPRGPWSCIKCDTIECNPRTFEDIVSEVTTKPLEKAFSFLKLPILSTIEFCNQHKDAMLLLRQRSLWRTKFPKARISEKVSGIYISRNNDRHLFVLPEPLEDPQMMLRSISSMAAAIKYSGMETYSEELIYNNDVPVSMNDAGLDLDSVAALSQKNLQLFREYKENLKLGVYPPIEVVYDPSIGFMVKALAKMKRHTIITEYVGEVTTVDKIGSTSSDSLMNLLHTGDDETSLIIDPSRVGNIARFFSGINNRKNMSKKKANIRTRRFSLDGGCRVVLFTAKDIKPGEILHYDYNAGIEGKDVDAMIQMGFYDTSNFL